jgi:MoaA/NifB/PqqE/SkfB family radical SAM enzyme
MLRIGNSSLLSPYEAFRLSLSSPRCSLNAVRDRITGQKSLRFPRRIILHLANRCNFACPMCSIGVARAERQKEHRGDVLWDVVEKTITEAGKYGCYVELLGGEPTLYGRLPDTISLLTNFRLPSYITTNGFNLKKRAREITEAGLKVLLISMDGWDEKSSYERGLVPGSFEAIREGIAEVNRIRRGLFPIVRIGSVITKANFRDFDRIADAVYEMGVRRWTIQNYFFMNDDAFAAHQQLKAETGIGDQLMMHHIPNAEAYFDRSEVLELQASLDRTREKLKTKYRDMRVDFNWDLDQSSYYSSRRPARSSSCALPFNRIDVYTDGKIASCGDGHAIGNVMTGSIYDAWNGPQRAELMALLGKERILPMCFRCCGIQSDLKFDETSAPYPRVGLGGTREHEVLVPLSALSKS